MLSNKTTICWVCGLNQGDFYPWGETGTDPTFTICDCCGIEFGYEDHGCDVERLRELRNYWIKGGVAWFSPRYKPENWSLEEQLRNIPTEFI